LTVLYAMEYEVVTSSRYFTIDDIRIKDMKERALRGLSLNVADWRTDQMWSVTSNKPISLQQGDLGFEVGRYTINSLNPI